MSAPISNSSNPTPATPVSQATPSTGQTGPASAVQSSVTSTSGQGTATPSTTDTINAAPLIWAAVIAVAVVVAGRFWWSQKPMRLWELRHWNAVIGIGLSAGIALVILTGQGFGATGTVTAAVVAATIAVASLVLSAANNIWGFNRARRVDTLKAWEEWNKACGAVPAKIAEHLGSNKLDQEKAAKLSKTRTDKLHGLLSDEDPMVKVVSMLTSYLNGLERIAAGIEVGAYDEALIRRLGATRLRMVEERFGPYIKYRQSKAEDSSDKAYENLDKLLERVKKEKGATATNPDENRVKKAADQGPPPSKQT